jgi:hypothetical protein
VATVLTELAEKIDPEKLAAAAQTVPLPWAQRLEYLLERAAEGGEEKTSLLKDYVRKTAKRTAVLLPAASDNGARHDHDWKLYINAEVEVEFL